MDYLPNGADPEAVLADPSKAYVSRYALGRDYHKLIRGRLAKLAKRIEAELGAGQYRAFVDSAPVLERALAENAGLGWIGKNTMLIIDKAGSWFFLGEIQTTSSTRRPTSGNEHCGSCRACLDICSTDAFTGSWCSTRATISYLTIEYDGSILESPRTRRATAFTVATTAKSPARGTNLQAKLSVDCAATRTHAIGLLECFSWDEEAFLSKTRFAIRRIGYERWRRNAAVALGNAPTSSE